MCSEFKNKAFSFLTAIEFGDVKFEVENINDSAVQNILVGTIPTMFYMLGENDDATKPEEATYRMYVLNGELKDGEWVLTTISNYGGGKLGGADFGFMRFNLHKLYQMKGLLDLKIVSFENKDLLSLVREVWAKEIGKTSERKVFENKFMEYIENPWII